MKFQTRYTRKDFPKTYEKGGGESKVERAGYISAKQRIENLLYAGRRLQIARAEMYDVSGEIDEDMDYYDPTRTPGYDMADATQDALEINARLRKAKVKTSTQEVDVKKEAVPLPADLNPDGK